MEFGEAIRELRKEKNLTSSRLAKESGISQAYLSQLETGKNKNPTNDIIKKLAKGLKVDYLQLLQKAGYIDEAEHLKKMASSFESINKKSQEQMNRINEKGNIINPEVFPQPNTIQRILNVPTTYKIDGEVKEFSNNDILNPYNYFSLALNKNDLFPLINENGEQISKNDLKKILTLIDTILK